MSEQVRLTIIWSPKARTDLRRIDRETAGAILHCIDRYLRTQEGDIKSLSPPLTGFRLRCGDYRILFDLDAPNGIAVTGVRHRREAYR